MATKRKTLSLLLLAIAMLAAPAAVASIEPNQALHPKSIDFRSQPAPPSGSQPFAIFTDPKLHAFEDVAGVDMPRPSISAQLERRFGSIQLATTQTRTSIFTHRVSKKLASGLRDSLDRAIIREVNDLGPKTWWDDVYVRNRWYSPETGTFISPDPMGYADSANLYAFAGGDPVNRRDPTGSDSVSASGVFITTDSNGRIRRVDYRHGFDGDVHHLYETLAADRVPMEFRDLIVERVSQTDQGVARVAEFSTAFTDYTNRRVRDLGSMGVSSLPYVGDAKDVQEVLTGRDLVTGEKLSKTDRIVTVVAAALPIVGGKVLREVAAIKRGAEVAEKEVIKETAKEGIIYLRRDRNLIFEEYVGQAESEVRYMERQVEHARAHPESDFEFFELDRAAPGVELDKAEEAWMRAGGGPKNKRNPAGKLSNKRVEMSEKRYRAAGGEVPK